MRSAYKVTLHYGGFIDLSHDAFSSTDRASLALNRGSREAAKNARTAAALNDSTNRVIELHHPGPCLID